MSPEQFRQVEELVLAAEEVSPQARRAWVEQRCADPVVAAEALSLLAVEPPEEFLAAPLVPAVSGEPELGSLVGPWRLGRKLGRGGMGTVYLATRADGVFERTAAVKMLDGVRAGALGQRFRREGALLARLDHPNIVRLLDAGVTPAGSGWLALERIEGVRCTEWAAAKGRRPEDVVALVLRICAAVQTAHAQLVVHRDLKPSNVLVDAQDQPHVLDFGEARLLELSVPDPQRTVAPGLTLNYASPEQILGQPASTLDDVYALGVLLHEMLTGQVPYSRASMTLRELVREAEGEGPAAPPMNGVPRDLAAVVAKALAHAAPSRYASVEKLAADLERYRNRYPVQARPPGYAQRAAMFLRRNRAMVAGAALAVGLLGTGVAMVARYALEAERQRQEASAHAERAERQRQEADRQREQAEQARTRETAALQAASGSAAEAVRQAAAAQEGLRAARSRFQEVRSLAGSLLYELEPAARKIPGSTVLRKEMVARAAGYFEKLAEGLTGEPGDEAIWGEIAEAWRRLGAVQGDRTQTFSLGDAAGALRSYQRALAAQEKRLQMRPGDRERRRAVEDARITVAAQLRQTGQPAEADRMFQASVKALTTLAQEQRDDSTLRSLARAQFYTDLRAYRALSEELLDKHPDDLTALRNAALAYKYIVPTDLSEVRLQNARRALALDERRAAKLPADPEVRFDLSFDWSMIGNALHNLNRHEEALEGYRRVVEIRRALARSDPTNVRFQERLAGGLLYLAQESISLGDWKQVRSAAEEATALAQALKGQLTGPIHAELAGVARALLARHPDTGRAEACRYAAEALELTANLDLGRRSFAGQIEAVREIRRGCQ